MTSTTLHAPLTPLSRTGHTYVTHCPHSYHAAFYLLRINNMTPKFPGRKRKEKMRKKKKNLLAEQSPRVTQDFFSSLMFWPDTTESSWEMRSVSAFGSGGEAESS